jgi:hypothetical protein
MFDHSAEWRFDVSRLATRRADASPVHHLRSCLKLTNKRLLCADEALPASRPTAVLNVRVGLMVRDQIQLKLVEHPSHDRGAVRQASAGDRGHRAETGCGRGVDAGAAGGA